MSYDISLVDPVSKKTLELDFLHQLKGGTYAMNGTTEAWLNITYNYAKWYRMPGVFPDRGEIAFCNDFGPYTINCSGIRAIYGLSGAESIPILLSAIKTLEDMDADLTDAEISDLTSHEVTGYWLPTRKNAIKPLHQLLALARMRPDGIWDGD